MLFCFITDIGDLCLLSFYFAVLAESLLNSFSFVGIFKNYFLFPFHGFLCLSLLFPSFCLFWVYIALLFSSFLKKVSDLRTFIM